MWHSPRQLFQIRRQHWCTLSQSIISTHLSTVATIGDTVTAAVIAVAASIATLVTTFCHLMSGKVASVAIELDRDVRALMILVGEQKI